MTLLASAYDQSKYFKAADLSAEKRLGIKSVTEELVGQGVDQKRMLIVWFDNDKRGLPLNRINNRSLRGAFGDACDDWTGKIVVVFPATAEFRGKMVPCLRVRIPAPKEAAPPAAQVADELNDELPW